MVKGKILILASFFAIAIGAITFGYVMMAGAYPLGTTYEDKKVGICHRHNAVTNPYNYENVSVDSIFRTSGHDGHIGPLVTTEAEADLLKGAPGQEAGWGDIIPPFDYTYQIGRGGTQNGHYDGKNYTTIGQAMLENDCNYVEKVTPAAVTFIDASCDVNYGTYVIPATAHVKYYVNDATTATAAGSYYVTTNQTVTIVAKADKGYYIGDTTTKSWTHIFTMKTAEECALGTQSVTPAAVIFAAPTCDLAGTYTIPTTKGVDYYIDGKIVAAGKYTAANGTTITVTAVAQDDYELKPGVTNQWTYTFTAPTDCVKGISTTGGGAGSLPATAADTTTATAILLSSVAAAITILGVVARNILLRRL